MSVYPEQKQSFLNNRSRSINAVNENLKLGTIINKHKSPVRSKMFTAAANHNFLAKTASTGFGNEKIQDSRFR